MLERDTWRERGRLHRHLAYVPGDVSLWPNLTGGEVIDLTLLGRLRGGLNGQRRAELIEIFDLDPDERSPRLLEGDKQKVALIAGLRCGTAALLDEPTAGLDPW